MKNKTVFIWPLLFVILFVFLHTEYCYHFFFVEQSQVFLLDSDFAFEKIAEIGGGAKYLSGFLTQFFVEPYCGALIVSLLLTLSACLTYKILKVLHFEHPVILLALLPAFFLLLMQLDTNYNMAGTIAYLIMVFLAVCYLSIPTYKVRLLTAFILLPFIYFAIGPTALLLTVFIILVEVYKDHVRGWASLALFLEMCVMALLSVYTCSIEDFRKAFLTDFYYQPQMKLTKVIYFSWGCFILLFPLSLFLDRWKWYKTKTRTNLFLIFQLLCLSAIVYWGVSNYGAENSKKFKEGDYYIRTRQWNKVQDLYKGKINNLLYLNQLNTALLQNGQLAEQMFKYDQKGVNGLILPWNKMENSSVALSDLFFALGINSASHQFAFDGYVSGHYNGNVRMLQRLVQNNLIDGEYPVAEKFIHMLELTYAYKDWAQQQRKYLYNDELVKNDPVLGKLKQSLPDTVATWSNGYEANLKLLIRHNPGNKIFVEFLGCFYLVSKNLPAFKALLEEYYGTETLPVLPNHFQEAVLLAYENDVDSFRKYKIPVPMMNRFLNFRKHLLSGQSRESLVPLLFRTDGDTYWFYLIFK